MVEDCHSDECSEPEKHGKRVQAQDGERVCEFGEESGGQGDVDEDGDGPDGAEELVGVLGGDVEIAGD